MIEQMPVRGKVIIKGKSIKMIEMKECAHCNGRYAVAAITELDERMEFNQDKCRLCGR